MPSTRHRSLYKNLRAMSRPCAEASHTFSKLADDWGFKQFYSLGSITDVSQGWMRQGMICLTADVHFAVPRPGLQRLLTPDTVSRTLDNAPVRFCPELNCHPGAASAALATCWCRRARCYALTF